MPELREDKPPVESSWLCDHDLKPLTDEHVVGGLIILPVAMGKDNFTFHRRAGRWCNEDCMRQHMEYMRVYLADKPKLSAMREQA